MCRAQGVEGERVKDGYHRWAAETYPGRTRMREANASMLQRFITHLEETAGAIFQPEAA